METVSEVQMSGRREFQRLGVKSWDILSASSLPVARVGVVSQ